MRVLHWLALLSSCMVATSARADDVRVFILAGQSNAVGYGDGASLPTELSSQSDVLYDFFNPASRGGGDYAGTTSSDWEALAPKGSGSWYGPELTFANGVKGALGGERTAVLKLAAGGSNIVEHWARGVGADSEYPEKSQLYHALLGTLDSAVYSSANDNELLYPDEATRLDRALSRLSELGHRSRFGCVLWVQGENEATWSAAFDYASTLDGLVSALREDLGQPELPFVIARTASQTGQAMGGPAPDDNLAAVRAAQESLAARDSRIELVDMDDLPGAGDNLHFTSAGYRTLGERLASACLPLLDATPSEPTTTSTGAGGNAAGGSDMGGTAAGGAGPEDEPADGGCHASRGGERGAWLPWLLAVLASSVARGPRTDVSSGASGSARRGSRAFRC